MGKWSTIHYMDVGKCTQAGTCPLLRIPGVAEIPAEQHRLTAGILAGQVNLVARALRMMEDQVPEALQILRDIYPHTARSYVIGITGTPGAGKSTITDELIKVLRQRGKTVGVVAVDPTSPFTGGALLGDRVRMLQHSLDEGVFIKSMATRGHLGGVAQGTMGVVKVLAASGKDVIIVETIGVGQGEIDIYKIADICLLVMAPGTGDQIQALKAGVMEIADLFIINKSDGEGGSELFGNIRQLCEDLRQKPELTDQKRSWAPRIVQIPKREAGSLLGVEALLNKILEHEAHQRARGFFDARREHRAEIELRTALAAWFSDQIVRRITSSGGYRLALAKLINGEIDPYSAAQGLLQAVA